MKKPTTPDVVDLRTHGLGRPAGGCSPARTKESQPMMDVFMLVIGIGFFALAVAYALACDRL
jgi:hypothetical protein